MLVVGMGVGVVKPLTNLLESMIKTLFEKVIDKITMFNYFTIFY